MTDDLAARLAALEAHVAAFLPAPLCRRENTHEPAPWLRAKMHAAIERRRAENDNRLMSAPHAAVVRVGGEITENTYRVVHHALEAASLARVLHVYVDSEGGCYDASLRIFRAIRWHGADEKIAFMGKHCDSGALLIALAADRRVMRRDSHALLHLVGGTPDFRDRWTAVEHLAAARRLSGMDGEMLNIVADRTGAALDVVLAEARTELPSDPEWLIAHGFVHEVLEAIP